MPIPEIMTWLSNQHYDNGVDLYKKFGGNSFLKKILAKGETAFNRDKLEKELRKINDSTSSDEDQALTVSEKKFKTPIKRELLPDDTPKEILILIEEKNKLLKEASFLHSHLRDGREEADRGVDAFRILDCWDRITEIWELLDYWKETKAIPEKPQEFPALKKMSALQLDRRKRNLRSYITKETNGKNRKETLDEYERELNVIFKMLNDEPV